MKALIAGNHRRSAKQDAAYLRSPLPFPDSPKRPCLSDMKMNTTCRHRDAVAGKTMIVVQGKNQLYISQLSTTVRSNSSHTTDAFEEHKR